MSLTTIREELLREFREYDPTHPVSASATEVNQYINWAYEDYCINALPCISSATTSIFQRDSVYNTPSDCILPFEIYVGSTKIGCRRYFEKDDSNPTWRTSYNTSVSEYIPLSFNQVETYPKKTSAGTLTFFYYDMPATVSSSTDFVIKDAEQRCLKDYVLAIMHLKGRNNKQAMTYMQRYYETRKRFMRATEESKSGDLGYAIKLQTRSEWNKRRFDR